MHAVRPLELRVGHARRRPVRSQRQACGRDSVRRALQVLLSPSLPACRRRVRSTYNAVDEQLHGRDAAEQQSDRCWLSSVPARLGRQAGPALSTIPDRTAQYSQTIVPLLLRHSRDASCLYQQPSMSLV